MTGAAGRSRKLSGGSFIGSCIKQAMIAPDDLEPGKKYKFSYQTCFGQVWHVEGVFVRMTVELDTLWLWFNEGNVFSPGGIPYDYGAVVGNNDLEEVL